MPLCAPGKLGESGLGAPRTVLRRDKHTDGAPQHRLYGGSHDVGNNLGTHVMANFKRSKPRLRTFGKRFIKRPANPLYCWSGNWPAAWDILYHRRPHRRATKRLEIAVMHGADPDNLAWPVAKKPHVYYW